MDPIYSNCNKAVTNYTTRVFNTTHELKHFNDMAKPAKKAAVKVEVLKEEIITAMKVATVECTVEETAVVTPVVAESSVDELVKTDTEVAVQEEPKKKRTSKKKKTTTEE